MEASCNHPMHSRGKVNFAAPRSFWENLRSDLKETFFPDDPFNNFSDHRPLRRAKLILQYFVPIFEWLPSYRLWLFRYDLLAGLTTASLAIPQGISYANLTNVPPIVGLYSSFVPAFIYTLFGSSKNVAVGTVAACSLLLAQTIGQAVDASVNPNLYLNLVFTATLIAGLFQTALGLLRLGILVDFLSHSTITGFMGGTAILIILQQLKGFLGLTHFTDKTDVVSLIITPSILQWRWESAVLGCIFLAFLEEFVEGKAPCPLPRQAAVSLPPLHALISVSTAKLDFAVGLTSMHQQAHLLIESQSCLVFDAP